MTTPSPPPRSAVQDVAPAGGYAPIDIRRNVPKSVTTRGAVGLFAAGGLVMAWGFYRLGTFNVHRRALKQEHKDNRLAIMPLLQAEEDARFVKQVCSGVVRTDGGACVRYGGLEVSVDDFFASD